MVLLNNKINVIKNKIRIDDIHIIPMWYHIINNLRNRTYHNCSRRILSLLWLRNDSPIHRASAYACLKKCL